MTGVKEKTRAHPTENELADFLSGTVTAGDRKRLEDHIAGCGACLENMVSAYESVKEFKRTKEKGSIMKKMNPYLISAIIVFILSFIFPSYFVQFLVAAIILGMKWITDSKSTKMLIMVYEAWKKGGDKEASRILSSLDKDPKNRL